MKFERHYFSSCWPDITGEEYEHLKDSINISGLREAITLYEGQILDGWNRYRACTDNAMEAHYVEFEGTPEEAEQFVQDKHNRRSLTLTQRLTCIGLMRQRPSVGRPKNTEGPSVLTAKDMAKKAGSSVRYAEHVNEAIAKGAPELVASMKSGKVGAEKAAAIAKLPKEEQAAAIHKPAPKPAPAVVEPEDDGPSAEELAAHAAAEAADRELVAKLLDSNEPLADLAAENKQLKAEIAQLKLARDGFMNRCNEAIALVKARDRQIAKLEKMLKEPA